MRTIFAMTLAFGLAFAVPADAWSDDGRFLIQLRGGALVRGDDGYSEHAEVFGLANPAVGGGGAVDLGVRVFPRLWLVGSMVGFTSRGPRRLDTLEVSNQAVIGQVGVTAFDVEQVANDQPLSIRLDVLAGAGVYRIADSLGDVSRSDTGPGLRAGSQITLSWRAIGLVMAYGHHFTRAHLSDRLGGQLDAGGHEIGAGLSLRW